jgi:hypothetical protein
MKILGRLPGRRLLLRLILGVLLALSLAALTVRPVVDGAVPALQPISPGSIPDLPIPGTPTLDPPRTPTPFLPVDVTPSSLTTPQARQLTQGGCCANPWWSMDSQWILFLDRPDEGEPVGLYGIPAEGGLPDLIFDRMGEYSRDTTLVAYVDRGQAMVERWADGETWRINNEGRAIEFSPSGQTIAWIVSSRGIEHPDLRQRAVWVAERSGLRARELVTVHGGELIGWTGMEDAILVSGRLAPDLPAGLWRIEVATGAGRLLFEADRIRNPLLSPGGNWVALLVAFDTDVDKNGIWIVGAEAQGARRLDLFGAYRWRQDEALIVVPPDLDQPGISLWQVAAASGEMWRLTDPELTSIPIANNDWEIAPDGSQMVFLSSVDRNLWVLTLPDP